MAPREIPGYFYDEVKQKYFRIQKNHVLPAGSAYTQQSIKETQQAKDLEAQQVTRQKREHDGRIKRSRLSSQLSILEHRIGQSRSSSLNLIVAQEYGRLLTQRPLIRGDISIEAGPRYGLGSSSFHILASGRLVLLANFEPEIVLEPASSYLPGDFAYNLLPEKRYPYSFTLPTPRVRAGGIQHIASLDETLLISTYRRSPMLILKKIGASREYVDARVCFDLQPFNVYDVWDLASCQARSIYAVATDQGLLTLPRESLDTSSPNRSLQGRPQRTVSFMESDPNIVISGGSDGYVNLTDIRSSNRGSSTMRLRYATPIVSAISRSGNPYQLIVGGMSSISLYDLRYTKAPQPSKKKQSFGKSSARSIPIMDFSVPHNRQMEFYEPYGKKMAYSNDLDAIITSSSWRGENQNSTYRVRIYSVKTGHMISSPLNNHNFPHKVRNIDIKRIRDGPESIITLSGDELMEWYPQEDFSLNDREDDGEIYMGKIHELDDHGKSSEMKNKNFTNRNMAHEWNRGNGLAV